MARIGWLVGVVLMAGCWSSDLIDGTFTPEQWAKLQAELALPDAHACDLPGAGFGTDAQACIAAQQLAQQLFSETALSCDPAVAMPCTPVSCATCHDPKRGLIDSRSPDNTSLAASGWTTRNSMTLLDVSYKEMFAHGAPVFTWGGGNAKLKQQFTSAGQVLDLAIQAPMKSSHGRVAAVILSKYVMQYVAAFGPTPVDDETIFHNLERAFDAYLATLNTHDSPFDSWLRGNVNAPISDSAKRGFAIFVGKGTCFECHHGPLFSDLDFHDTGVPQKGDNVPLTDLGRGAITMDAADNGKFLTASLRDIAATGPYMHDGVFRTLGEVIDFYRHGGLDADYSGTRDPRITPLDLTDADAADLEAFLRSLSDHDCDDDSTMCGSGMGSGSGSGMGSGGGPGSAMPDAGVVDAPPLPCGPPFMVCATGCFDLQTDPMHCGSCSNTCVYPNPSCVMGQCAP